MENSPYKIRFDILAMAKDLLMEEWHSKRTALEQEWQSKINYQYHIWSQTPHLEIPYPEMPPAPSVARITELATDLNAFVSRKV